MIIIDKILEAASEDEKNELSISNLFLIEKDIEIIFTKIKSSQSIISSKQYFDILEKIQFILAKLSFGDEMILSSKLNKFVKDFDRLDDKVLVEYLYFNIKNDSYPIRTRRLKPALYFCV